MNCIDAIEGTLKSVIRHLFRLYRDNQVEDTDYAREVKTVIEATCQFLKENKEIIENHQILESILYQYAKQLWLKHILSSRRTDNTPSARQQREDEKDYFDYFFDYIYNNETYPQWGLGRNPAVEINDHEAIKTEIKDISKSIDRILQKVAEYELPRQVDSEQAPKEME